MWQQVESCPLLGRLVAVTCYVLRLVHLPHVTAWGRWTAARPWPGLHQRGGVAGGPVLCKLSAGCRCCLYGSCCCACMGSVRLLTASSAAAPAPQGQTAAAAAGQQLAQGGRGEGVEYCSVAPWLVSTHCMRDVCMLQVHLYAVLWHVKGLPMNPAHAGALAVTCWSTAFSCVC